MTLLKDVKFVPEQAIEIKAYHLLADFEAQYGTIVSPPVPIDRIIEKFLDLRFDWDEIDDTEDDKILGCLLPGKKKILMNSRHVKFFDQYWGTEAYTKAHEVGHWDLHVVKPGDPHQLGLPGFDKGKQYLCRNSTADSREIQAEIYAAYLLMPHQLVMQEIDGLDLTRWPNLYRLKDIFGVSITAMTKRLSKLGLIYVRDKVIYRSEEESQGYTTMF
ncbi:MAG: ImmA/IrrE family metallo-endopeptidase [Anaerolineales bacterium]|nr:ImmA/IrrE family metallo-endopeptidase [Chloroflexota bacterium]MBL6982736.1 ImmA/IrrE family metallo-endopeptidase [Anaerolineales bacterium]